MFHCIKWNEIIFAVLQFDFSDVKQKNLTALSPSPARHLTIQSRPKKKKYSHSARAIKLPFKQCYF